MCVPSYHFALCAIKERAVAINIRVAFEFENPQLLTVMDSTTIAIHWHDDNQPIYTADFQPARGGHPTRLVTGGGDNNVRVWAIHPPTDSTNAKNATVTYLSTLRKHTQAVNAARFDGSGSRLATASDDGLLIIWVLADEVTQDFGEHDEGLKESWSAKRLFNTNSEICDISWSPDSNFIAAGSMDNSIRVFDANTGQKVLDLIGHSHYVQGISWDPRGEYLATQSADRSLHIYLLKLDRYNTTDNHERIGQNTDLASLVLNLSRSDLPLFASSPTPSQLQNSNGNISSSESDIVASELLLSNLRVPQNALHNTSKEVKSSYLYHPESLQSFFRRLAFSPDGSLLLSTLGMIRREGWREEDDASETFLNAVYVHVRSGLSRSPVCYISGFDKPAIAIRFSPVLYELDHDVNDTMFQLPHKMIFAIATQNSVVIYDSQHLRPLGLLKNLHYSTITDLAWSSDGKSIIVTSAEGFCSIVLLTDAVLGTPLKAQETFKMNEQLQAAQLTGKVAPSASLSVDYATSSSKNEAHLTEASKTKTPDTVFSKSATLNETAALPVFSDHVKVPGCTNAQGGMADRYNDGHHLISQFMEPPIESFLNQEGKSLESRSPDSSFKKRRVKPTQISTNLDSFQ